MSYQLRSAMVLFVALMSTQAIASEKLIYLGPQAFDPAPEQVKDFKAVGVSQWILQFHEPVDESVKDRVSRSGARILNYIPEDSLLVLASGSALSQVKGVRAILPMRTEWKLGEFLRASSVFNSEEVVKVRVRAAVSKLENLPTSIKLIQQSETHWELEGPRRALLALASRPTVLFMEAFHRLETFVLPLDVKQVEFKANPEFTGFESGTRIAKFEGAWSRGFNGAGQQVAVADTGLDMGSVSRLHPDFSSVRKGYSFGLFARDWSDPQGHGTHVSGSVGGSGSASEGRMSGGAYGAEVIPQGMWSPVLNNLTVPTTLSDMFQPAYDDGARAHTNSWGSPRDLGSYTGMSQQVDEFMWNNPEFLILFAAGNSGVDGDKDGRIDEGSVSSPGTAKNALTVGASENYLLEGGIQRTLGELLEGEPWGVEPLASDRLSNNPTGIAAFSSRGPTRDGRLKPEIVAPGTNIVSVCSRVDGATQLWGAYDENYCYAGGTSMSTPLTAGGAAVARQFLVERLNQPRPSAALVKALLMHSAENLFPGQYGDRGKSSGQELLVDGPNMHQGFGRLDMEAATNASALYHVVDNTQGLASSERFAHTLNLEDSKPLKVTLVYTDAPASPSASRTLVNNLDLKVVMNGQELLSDSRVNNHEQIQLPSLSGQVSIEVVGTNVPMGKNGKQPFALIIGN